jgi:hypothetical protein
MAFAYCSNIIADFARVRYKVEQQLPFTLSVAASAAKSKGGGLRLPLRQACPEPSRRAQGTLSPNGDKVPAVPDACANRYRLFTEVGGRSIERYYGDP